MLPVRFESSQPAFPGNTRVLAACSNACLTPASPPAILQTRAGMARYGHLADGRLKLVLVKKCSPLQVGLCWCCVCAGRRWPLSLSSELS